MGRYQLDALLCSPCPARLMGTLWSGGSAAQASGLTCRVTTGSCANPRMVVPQSRCGPEFISGSECACGKSQLLAGNPQWVNKLQNWDQQSCPCSGIGYLGSCPGEHLQLIFLRSSSFCWLGLVLVLTALSTSLFPLPRGIGNKSLEENLGRQKLLPSPKSSLKQGNTVGRTYYLAEVC
jgi:hypothetical protein